MKISSIRGTHDLYGSEIEKFNKIRQNLYNFANIFDFNEIQTPIFETSELFSKPLGEHSDVVLKEMYTFLDRNKESITLRPEFTTPMIRAAISNNLLNNLPIKLFGIGPVFRRERPQKGRYRQFNQINFETFGAEDPFSDIELILLAHKFLNSLIPNIKIELYLNSLGDRNTLNLYKKELTNFYKKNKINLSDESQKKIISNPLRILDTKNFEDQQVSKKAPLIIEFLSKEALKFFEEIKSGLKNLNVKFTEDTSLVRGLDYYCHTVYEFKTEALGSQDTIIGGGRYDGLIEKLGGKNIPGTGWAGGVERIMLLMENLTKKPISIHFAILDDRFKNHALKAYNLLIEKNLSVTWNYKFNLKKSLSQASEQKASHIIIVGEDEFKDQSYTVKSLKDGSQQKLVLDNLFNQIKNE